MSKFSHSNSYGESGEPTSPVWLLFNPKHPFVREYILKLVLAEIQETLFKAVQARMDTSKVYIRNAVNDSRIVPDTLNWWNKELLQDLSLYRELVQKHQPKVIISFGSFPFEFVRRSLMLKPEKGPKFWSTCKLGDEFKNTLTEFDVNRTNILPLLRRMTECEKFMGDGPVLEDYYPYVGRNIALKLIENKDIFYDILIE